MSRRSSVMVALFAVLSLVATACSGTPAASGGAGTSVAPSGAGTSVAPSGAGTSVAPSGAASGESGAPADISGDLQVGATYAEGADEIATTRYDVFMDQYEGAVNVQFTEANFDAQAFLASVTAGTPPDVVRMDRSILGTYISQGALESLDQCIANAGVDMSQYREAAVTQVTFGGQVYAIPEFYDSRIILINDSVLEEVDLTPEDIDTSDWDALSAINEQLLANEGGELTRIGFDPKLPEFLPLWVRANGSNLISEDGLTSNLDDPLVAEALEYAASLVLAHGDAASFLDLKANGPGSAFFGPENQFTEDTVGAFPMEQWYLNVLANDTPDESISFQPFKDRQGNPLTLSGGSAWAIPAAADNKEAACEFARVITLPDSWYAAAKVRADMRAADGKAFTGVYTGNTIADERIFGELVTPETAGEFYEGVELVQSLADSSFSVPATAAAEEFTRIWQDAVQRVLDGVPATQALADADADAQDAIDRAQP